MFPVQTTDQGRLEILSLLCRQRRRCRKPGTGIAAAPPRGRLVMTPKSCYELLGVLPTASPVEIKQAFRKAIAQYHPDKVQHLEVELQRIAAVRAAEITEAYRSLSAGLADDDDSRPGSHGFHSRDTTLDGDRDAVTALLRRAILARLRDALREGGWVSEQVVPPFDVSARLDGGWGRKGWKILGRMVDELSDATIQQTLTSARKIQCPDSNGICLLLMGRNVSALRHGYSPDAGADGFPRSACGLFLIRVDVRTWQAECPSNTPSFVRALLKRLSV